MDRQFWRERWRRGEIGFHQATVNTYLRAYWPSLACPPGSQVFVPLCGKSRDMRWLRAQGHRVLGVELAEAAIESFYAEQQLHPRRQQAGRLECWLADAYQLYVGDLFDLGADALADIYGAYDRAALIALPPSLRWKYAQHLCATLPVQSKILLVTMDYPQEQMPGPPFSVSAAEVHELFAGDFVVSLLATRDALADEPRLQQRGLQSLREQAYLLARR